MIGSTTHLVPPVSWSYDHHRYATNIFFVGCHGIRTTCSGFWLATWSSCMPPCFPFTHDQDRVVSCHHHYWFGRFNCYIGSPRELRELCDSCSRRCTRLRGLLSRLKPQRLDPGPTRLTYTLELSRWPRPVGLRWLALKPDLEWVWWRHLHVEVLWYNRHRF